MKPIHRTTSRIISAFVLVTLCVAGVGHSAPQRPQPGQTSSAVIRALEQELERSMQVLKNADPAAYFIGYTVTEQQRAEVQGSNGALLESHEERARFLEVQVRVGDYKEDNTRKVGDRPGFPDRSLTAVPIEDDVPVLRRSIWLETDRDYRQSAEAYIKVQTGKQVKVETAEGQAPDFSREAPQVSYAPRASFQLDRKPWEERVRLYTRELGRSALVYNSIVTFTALAENEYQANSEGTRLQFGRTRFRLELYVQSKAEDGMDVNRYYNFDWTDPAGAPSDQAVLAAVKNMIREVEALRQAPLVDPNVVPVLLTGRAAAVFFHEVFGHRAEGHRQKDINEGQTFTRKVGQKIMPEFISVYDDPTQAKAGNTVLLGNYAYDDEGVKAQRVSLVEKGVLKSFLLSRSPLVDFPHSNGHGRRQPGNTPVARQGNLIVHSDRTVTNAKLREMLIAEIKSKGKPFGLVIDDLAGGFTFTGRGLPQAFQLTPLVVYRVYPDGRPDEIVRGVDIAGTALASLDKIAAAGDTPEVFNGYCGAESGFVPVAAVAPAMLISEMEIQKKETSTDKPPILPPPAHDPQAKRGRP